MQLWHMFKIQDALQTELKEMMKAHSGIPFPRALCVFFFIHLISVRHPARYVTSLMGGVLYY